MTEAGGGRHCERCDETVHDFVGRAVGDAAASNVPRDAGPAVDAGVDAHPPLMGKLVFVADD